MAEAKRILRWRPRAQLLWASPRELLNVFQAEEAGCDIITMAPELLRRMGVLGKNLAEYSLETVEMFHRDALAAAYAIDIRAVAGVGAELEGAVGKDDFHGLRKVPGEVVGAGVRTAGEGREA